MTEAALLLVGALIASMVWLMRNGAKRPPGEDKYTVIDDSLVAVASVPQSEAVVVRALLESNGIRATVEASSTFGRGIIHAASRARHARVLVAPEDVEAAEELLASSR